MKIIRYTSLYRTRVSQFRGRRAYTGLAAVAVAAGLLAGCGSVNPNAIDYKSSGAAPQNNNTLQAPPDLVSSVEMHARPPASGTADLATLPQVAGTVNHPDAVLPPVQGMSIQRDGTARWLVVKNRSFDQLWPEVRKFWEEQGFLLVVDQRNSGVMETDWNETHAQVDLDLVRGLLSKALDNAYVTGERNKYRTRFENGPDGSVYIFISQKGMHEMVSGANNESSTWEVEPNDPGLEAIYLTRLMDSIGRQENGGPVAMPAAPVVASGAKGSPPKVVFPSRAADVDTNLVARGAPPVIEHQMTLPESYDQVWLRTGLALDRANFTVDSRNRDTGIYAIRYVDPTDMSVEEQGFWHQVFHGKKEKKALNFSINVKALTETSTRVAVVDDAGTVQGTPQADRILHLIADQMR